MNLTKNVSRSLVTLVVTGSVLAVMACSKPGAENPQAAAVDSPSVPHQQDKIPDKTPGRSPYTKPGADITLAENQVFELSPGIAAEIELELLAHYVDGRMSVTLVPSEGLTISAGETQVNFSLNPNAIYLIPLTVQAVEPGRYYLQAHVQVDSEGRQTFRALSAIVQVGPKVAGAKSSQVLQKVEGKPSVIVLPANETILQE